METQARDYRTLRRALSRVRRAWRLNAAAQGLLVCAAAAALPVAAGVVGGAGGYARPALLGLAAALGAVLLLWRVAWPLARPLGWTDVSRMIERRDPALQERLTSAVELWPEARAQQPRFAPQMLSALLRDAASAARAVRLNRALNLRATARAALFFFAALFVCALGFAARPHALARVPAFISPPYMPRPAVYAIEWVSGGATIPAGGGVTIRARLSGDAPGAPRVTLAREGLAPQSRGMRLEQEPQTFALRLDRVQGDTTYTVSVGNKKSRAFRIVTVEPPRVEFVRTRLTYPAHTGIPPELRENAGDIAAPFGTRVKIEVGSSSPLQSAHLMLNGKKKPLKPAPGRAPRAASGSFTVDRDARYTVRLVDAHGFGNRTPPEYSIRALPDADPEITLERPEGDLEMPRAAAVAIRGAARDDYGVVSVTLHYRIVDSERRGSLRVPVTPGPEVSWEFPWDLTRAQAFPGDVIEFWLSAADNDTLTGPKSARTAARRISILSPYEEYREVERETDAVISSLSAAVREADAVSQTFKSLSQNLAQKNAAEWKHSADVQRALDRQAALERELADISNSMERASERMQTNEFVSLDTLEKMQQIQSIMDSILTEDMKQLIQKIQKNLENVDISQMDRELLESLQDHERLLRNLENTLERLKRIQAEQKLNAMSEHLDQLTRSQENVVKQAQELKSKQDKGGLSGADRRRMDQLAREEERINREMDEELERMDALAQELAPLDSAAAEHMRAMREQSRDQELSGNLRDATDSLRSARMPRAAQRARAALDTMLKLSRGAQDLESQFSAQMSAAMRAMLMRSLRKALNLSDAQEQTLAQTERMAARPGRSVTDEEESRIVSGARLQRDVLLDLAADLAALANATMLVSPMLSADARAAARDIDLALEDLKQDRPAADAHFRLRGAFTAVNRIMLALLDAKSGGENPGQGGAMQQLMDQLQSLADSQESINQQTRQLMQGGLPIPQMGAGMQALAAQQRLLRQGVSKLMESAESMSGMGGRLREIEEQMEEIERQLMDAKADPGVQRRQADVLRRLKDASLSLRRETHEDRRKAETAGRYAPAAPPALEIKKGPELPEHIRMQIQKLKQENRIPGFENAIDAYYRDLLKVK